MGGRIDSNRCLLAKKSNRIETILEKLGKWAAGLAVLGICCHGPAGGPEPPKWTNGAALAGRTVVCPGRPSVALAVSNP